MKLNIKKGEDCLVLPVSCAAMLNDADSSDLRLLIYIAECETSGTEFDIEKAANALLLDESDIRSSLKFWRGASVLVSKNARERESAKKEDKAKSHTPPVSNRHVYIPSGELCEIKEKNEEFGLLIDTAEQTFGHIFNTYETEIIANMYVNLELSSDYILALLKYFRAQEKNLRYTEKVAYDLVDKGITTPKDLEEHLKWRELHDSFEGEVRSIFGIGRRQLTSKEEQILTMWRETYKYSADIIKAAYEVTINNTEKPSLSYTNKVLETWYKDGVRTLEDAQAAKDNPSPKSKAARSPQKKTTRAGTATARSFDIDNAFEKALERSYKGAEE